MLSGSHAQVSGSARPDGAVRIMVAGTDRWTTRLVNGLAIRGVRGVVVAFGDEGGDQADRLAGAIETELLRAEAMPNGRVEAADWPLTSRDDALDWAGTDMSVLVAVSPDGTPWEEEPWQDRWLSGHEVRALPCLPLSRQAGAACAFPGHLRAINAAFWRADVAELVPTVLARLGLAAETPRIFISYRRHEAQGLADQLFEALAERNFDVFLDCFRLPPGVDFQRRLTQELGDKSVVLVLESAGILDSKWTRYEIDTARTHGLGLLALHLPGGTEVPSVDATRRQGWTRPICRDRWASTRG